MSTNKKDNSKTAKRIVGIVVMCIILDLVILCAHFLWINDLRVTLTIIVIADLLIVLFGEKIFKLLLAIVFP